MNEWTFLFNHLLYLHNLNVGNSDVNLHQIQLIGENRDEGNELASQNFIKNFALPTYLDEKIQNI